MIFCPYPKKQFYLTRADAVTAAATIRTKVEKRGDTYTPLHPYRCPDRNHWHLSSAKQGRAPCPTCSQPQLPAWLDPRTQTWVIYAHGDCRTQKTQRK